MTNIPDWLDDGAGSATCALLGAGTAVAAAFAANSARSLLLWPALGGAAATAAFAAVGHAIGCAANPDNPPFAPADGWTGSWCTDGSTRTRVQIFNENGDPRGDTRFFFHADPEINPLSPGSDTQVISVLSCPDGQQGCTPAVRNVAIYNPVIGETVIMTPDAGCADPGSRPIPLTAYTFNYTDASTTCNYTYTLQDTWIDSDGYPRFAWGVEGADSNLRNNCQGGRIAGYVWAPSSNDRYTYNVDFDGPGSGPPGGPGWIFTPDWGSIAGLLLRLMEYNDPGDLYRLISVCETDADGEPVSRSVEVDIPAGFRNPAASARVRFEAMVELMQGLKDFRQPICRGPRTVGELVTVHFVSDEISSKGTKPLRKYLRYRDQLGATLGQHAAHWEDFVWNAGPVCVIHKGADWGYLQVWAEDADEGKRVIRHAGDIAGISPDTEGQWLITDSTDPRYGRTGTMRLARRQSAEGEFLRISKRPGPNGLPTVPFDPGR